MRMQFPSKDAIRLARQLLEERHFLVLNAFADIQSNLIGLFIPI